MRLTRVKSDKPSIIIYYYGCEINISIPAGLQLLPRARLRFAHVDLAWVCSSSQPGWTPCMTYALLSTAPPSPNHCPIGMPASIQSVHTLQLHYCSNNNLTPKRFTPGWHSGDAGVCLWAVHGATELRVFTVVAFCAAWNGGGVL